MDLIAAIHRKASEGRRVQEAFFAAHADGIAACAERLAARFDEGARLWVMGNGGSGCDAQHVALEFVHPVYERRPAIPALALNADAAVVTAVGNDTDFSRVFAHQLELHARAGDIALALSTSGQSANVVRALRVARDRGLVTVGVTGRDGGRMAPLCDFCFVVPSFAIHRIQEVHVALLHVLWDAIHVLRGEEDVL